MNDLIRRQDAIDALCAVCGNDCDKSEFVYNAPQDEQVILCPEHYCLCTLPSAETESTRIISETRAIPSDDERVSLFETVTATYYDEENEEWSQRIVTVRDVLDSVCDEYTVLPSAETEIIKCKDCKYASPNGKYGCKAYHFKPCETHTMYADDYCSRAERRTDE